ncbi:MAG TPA: hypothetical protein VNH44_04735 [Micropepsaceae bacterium]|nr:hypothetical protein [Micropepsaceae bacterium]
MPLESVLFLALVLAALSVFAAVLAYAEWTTRKIAGTSPAAEPAAAPTVAKPHAQPTHATIHEKAA